MAQTFHCPNCGAPLDPPAGSEAVMRCPFCSSSVIIPEELRRQAAGPGTLSRAQALAEMPESARDIMEIIRLVKVGQREEAIQTFRQAFDTSRADAAASIEAIERNQMVQLSYLDASASVEPAVYSQATDAAGSMPGQIKLQPRRRSCGITLVLAGVLLIVAVSALVIMAQPGAPLHKWWQRTNPASKTPLLLSFGEEGIQPGQISDPYNLAVDQAGNIFAADFTTGRILQYDAQGNFMRLWDAGDGKVVIRALEIDQDGILYAAIDRVIRRYDTQTGREIEPLPNPSNYFFEDFKLISGGGFGALVDSVDLVRLNPDGSTAWLVENAIFSATGESDTGGKLVVDGSSNFYLGGRFVEVVLVFSPDGRYLNRWGSEGEEPGQFDFIYAMTIDHQGRVVVSDNNGLEIFSPDGRFLEEIRLGEVAFDIQFDPAGKFYTVTNHPPRVNVYQLK